VKKFPGEPSYVLLDDGVSDKTAETVRKSTGKSNTEENASPFV
jgi:hypothetical protein